MKILNSPLEPKEKYRGKCPNCGVRVEASEYEIRYLNVFEDGGPGSFVKCPCCTNEHLMVKKVNRRVSRL